MAAICLPFPSSFDLNANGGQVMKEYLAEHGIPAAQINQRTRRAPRRAKRKFSGRKNSFPMHSPVSFQKNVPEKKIASGEIH